MARIREFDEAVTVEAAMRVFWQNGFESTSLPMLLAAMQLSKSSFYATFQSKRGLFRRCLNLYADEKVASMEAALASSPSGLGFLRNTLRSVADESHDTKERIGCFIMNIASEFGQSDAEFAELVTRHCERFHSIFEQALVRAKAEGDWQSDLSAEVVARYVHCAMSGLKNLSKAGVSPEALRETAELTVSTLP